MTGLYRLWRGLDNRAREKIVERIAGIVCEVNEVDLAGMENFLSIPQNWLAALLSRVDRDVDALLRDGGIPTPLADQLRGENALTAVGFANLLPSGKLRLNVIPFVQIHNGRMASADRLRDDEVNYAV